MRKTKLITVKDVHKKEKIQELLAFHSIPYTIRLKNLSPRNMFDNAMMVSMPVQYDYIFYVEKDKAEYVLELLKAAER